MKKSAMLVIEGEKSEVIAPPALRHLNAADGYLFFGLLKEAIQEIELCEKMQGHEAGLIAIVRNRIMIRQKRYQEVSDRLAPRLAFGATEMELFIQRTFALRALDRIEEAAEVFTNAPDRWQKSGIMYYNLGCYEALYGCPQSARTFFDAAFQMNKDLRRAAKKDPDLQALFY